MRTLGLRTVKTQKKLFHNFFTHMETPCKNIIQPGKVAMEVYFCGDIVRHCSIFSSDATVQAPILSWHPPKRAGYFCIDIRDREDRVIYSILNINLEQTTFESVQRWRPLPEGVYTMTFYHQQSWLVPGEQIKNSYILWKRCFTVIPPRLSPFNQGETYPNTLPMDVLGIWSDMLDPLAKSRLIQIFEVGIRQPAPPVTGQQEKLQKFNHFLVVRHHGRPFGKHSS